jgi:hypothetical protein
LELYYGDDWFFWQHRLRGRCCLALDMWVKSGEHAGLPVAHHSGFTNLHPALEAFLGEPKEDIARRDHAAARRYFKIDPKFRANTDEARRVGYTGPTMGLLPEVMRGKVDIVGLKPEVVRGAPSAV